VRRTRSILSPQPAVQLSLFDIAGFERKAIARHTRNANAATLLARIERAAQIDPQVLLDLRGEISQYATSSQVLDLLLVERVVAQQINPVRLLSAQAPIELGYLLPDMPSIDNNRGFLDIALLGLHYHLAGLTSSQKLQFEEWASTSHSIETKEEDDGPELGEVTLLPIVPIEGKAGSVEPLVRQTRRQLEALLHQGMPGIDTGYIQQIVTFIEESASNIRDHAGEGTLSCEGFVAANRTRRRYRDRVREQWVEVYTTYVSCYDLGRGIFAALVSAPEYTSELTRYPETERGIAALRLAILPGVTSKSREEGRGGGLPRIVNIVRSMAEFGNDQTYTYRGGLRIVSGGTVLDTFTTTSNAGHERVLPGTQLLLRFEAIRRTNTREDSYHVND
jgi:hypothetical protein